MADPVIAQLSVNWTQIGLLHQSSFKLLLHLTDTTFLTMVRAAQPPSLSGHTTRVVTF
jgi:hypothetical protein